MLVYECELPNSLREHGWSCLESKYFSVAEPNILIAELVAEILGNSQGSDLPPEWTETPVCGVPRKLHEK